MAEERLDVEALEAAYAGTEIVRKPRDAEAMLNSGQDEAAVLQALEVSPSTYLRWQNQCGGMKSEKAKRLSSWRTRTGCSRNRWPKRSWTSGC